MIAERIGHALIDRVAILRYWHGAQSEPKLNE